MKGRIISKGVRKKISEARKGMKFSKEHCINIGLSKKGKGSKHKNSPSKEHRIKLSKANLGKKLSKETRKKISEGLSGEKSYLWKGGITEINIKIRNNIEYRLWREAVFSRDNWTCQTCGKVWKDGERRLDVHHKDCDNTKTRKTDVFFKELDNMVTLCHKCHLRLPEHTKKMTLTNRKNGEVRRG